MDKISTGENESVFYSGRGNRQRAEQFALNNGKTTLEMTPKGKYLDDQRLFDEYSPMTSEQALRVWKGLSKEYANAANGNTYAFVNGSNPNSIFNTVEYPILEEGKGERITNIFSE